MKICSEEACNAVVKAKGLCSKHLSRLYRNSKTETKSNVHLIYIAGRDLDGPLLIGYVDPFYIRRPLTKAKLGLFAAFFARPTDTAKIQDSMIFQGKELDVYLGNRKYLMNVDDAKKFVRKCAFLVGCKVMSPSEHIRDFTSGDVPTTGGGEYTFCWKPASKNFLGIEGYDDAMRQRLIAESIRDMIRAS